MGNVTIPCVLDNKLTDVEQRAEDPVFVTLTPVNEPDETEKRGNFFFSWSA